LEFLSIIALCLLIISIANEWELAFIFVQALEIKMIIKVNTDEKGNIYLVVEEISIDKVKKYFSQDCSGVLSKI
jgi:hypothetical protein